MNQWYPSYLIRFIKQAEPPSDPELVDVVALGAVGELVGLHVLQPHDGLRHDAAVPVAAEALLAAVVVAHAWKRYSVSSEGKMFWWHRP